jgi:hypothetical protein
MSNFNVRAKEGNMTNKQKKKQGNLYQLAMVKKLKLFSVLNKLSTMQ